MSPTIVIKDGKSVEAVGSPGGSTIITTVLQTLLNQIDFGMSLPDAIEAPRASQPQRASTNAEPAFIYQYGERLTAKGETFTGERVVRLLRPHRSRPSAVPARRQAADRHGVLARRRRQRDGRPAGEPGPRRLIKRETIRGAGAPGLPGLSGAGPPQPGVEAVARLLDALAVRQRPRAERLQRRRHRRAERRQRVLDARRHLGVDAADSRPSRSIARSVWVSTFSEIGERSSSSSW